MLRGQHPSSAQKPLSPNTAGHTWEINEQLTTTNTWTAVCMNLTQGLNSAHRQPWLKPFGSGTPPPCSLQPTAPEQPWYICLVLPQSKLLLRPTVQHVCCWILLLLQHFQVHCLHISDPQAYLPWWECQQEPDFAYFIPNCIPLFHASFEEPSQATLWGDSLPHFTPLSMPTHIATLTKPSTTAKAGAP